MRFGLNVGYSGARLELDMDLVHEAERAGFKIMNMGVGRFKVYGPEGEELHKNYLPEDVAVGLLDKLAPLTPAEDE